MYYQRLPGAHFRERYGNLHDFPLSSCIRRFADGARHDSRFRHQKYPNMIITWNGLEVGRRKFSRENWGLQNQKVCGYIWCYIGMFLLFQCLWPTSYPILSTNNPRSTVHRLRSPNTASQLASDHKLWRQILGRHSHGVSKV